MGSRYLQGRFAHATFYTRSNRSDGGQSMATFLASEIAEKIQAPGENPVRVLNRVRNWMKMGLLRPVGDAHPGSGRASEYSEDTLLDAALLQKFTMAGIAAVDAAAALKEAKEQLEEKTKRTRDWMLVIHRPRDQYTWSVGMVEPSGLGGFIKRHFPNETCVVVYVKALLEQLGL
jgi:hypothetical protein